MSGAGQGPSNGTLQDACQEARYAVDQQIEKIHREDEKAVRIFRANLLFISILASGIAFASQADGLSPGQFGNFHAAAGVVLIFLSTLIAAMAYTSSNFRMGVKPSAINEAHTMTRNRYLNKLSKEYAAWVETNHKAHRLNAHTINAALTLALISMLFFTVAVAIGMMGVKGTALSYAALVVELPLALLVGGLVYRSEKILYFFMEGVEP